MNIEHQRPERVRPRRFTGELGASLVEYALIVALIAVVCVGAITFLGRDTSDTMDDGANGIGASTPQLSPNGGTAYNAWATQCAQGGGTVNLVAVEGNVNNMGCFGGSQSGLTFAHNTSQP